jgi:hypothetical protein
MFQSVHAARTTLLISVITSQQPLEYISAIGRQSMAAF